MPAAGTAGLLAIFVACAPAGHALISEILYDATGDDTGHEYVELHNSGPTTVALAGARLEAGDGAGPGRWTTRWTGGARDSLLPGAYFVIGGALVDPPADAVVTLDLQNGPDAVRLTWPDGSAEVVGYGALSYSEYFCGAPAPDVSAGQSLARIPDDSNRGSNALDFAAAEPSPARPNQVRLDAAISPLSLTLEPEQPASGAAAKLSGTLVNRGLDPLDQGSVPLGVSANGAPIASASAPFALAAGESTRVELALPGLAAGKYALELRAALPEDARPSNDAATLLARVGPGPLTITEIQFHPSAGEGEWVEVRSRDPAGVEVGEFRLSDRGGHPGTPDLALWLAPDSLALLVEDRAALLAHYPTLDPSRVGEVRPWSALNNSDDSSGVADIVSLRERDGTPCDRVAYGAHGVPAGVPLELIDGTWRADSDPSGTPLAPPRPPPSIAGRFELAPRRLRAGETPRLVWSLPWPRARITIEAFDLAGRFIAREIQSTTGARGEWRIEFLRSSGLYLLSLEAHPESGGASLREMRIVRIEDASR
ncbi:MAG: lamin tail domain-containing protein [Candidatus Eisenbacteria bacterium]|nr:lamin tail domain-containing protein [Candidatus Eisenbacteria bacterium]